MQETHTAIPFSSIGQRVAADYTGDGIGMEHTAEGAHLRTAFQKLEAHATQTGLTVTSQTMGGGSVHLAAHAWGRTGCMTPLPIHGEVTISGEKARFVRPGLTEEYSVSVDGVRQDFILEERAEGAGTVEVRLALTGAKAVKGRSGAYLVLDQSGRELAYDRLHVTDARHQVLPATMEVVADDLIALHVDDRNAHYPVRIDPTFSDANWVSMSPGMNDIVYALAVSGTDLYVGGKFTTAGGVSANRIAKWDGSTWSALGSGMNGSVYALAVVGTDLYAGGFFTTAGGTTVDHIAKWDGATWSALGTGTNDLVAAFAVIGTDLYAGGWFTTAGGSSANHVAKWDGSAWSALGTGMNNYVMALAVNGTDLFAGGWFTTAGGGSANQVAKWDGSTWSALGTGVNSYINAMAVSGTDLFVGGNFTSAGGSGANRVARWNGSAWSALGTGVNNIVYSLATAGTDLYVGGTFSTAGGSSANRIAKWNGTSWEGMGSGMNGYVNAMVVSGNDLYAGGSFTTAGGTSSQRIVRGIIGPDSDNDGIVDPLDDCPFLFGQIGDPCDDSNILTTNDEITPACTCSGTPCGGNAVVVNINTDADPAQITWEITDELNFIVASGGPNAGQANMLVSFAACLSASPGDACYGFHLFDSFGDGITGGGWELRTTDGKLILRDNFSSGSESPANPQVSPGYGSTHSFCLPLGPVDIAPTECGIFNNLMGNKVYAVKQNGTNYLGQTVKYQFEFSDPDAGFIRRIAKTTNYVTFWDMASVNPLTPGVTYFARVRTDKFGPLADAPWGAGCEMAISTSVTGCPQLVQAPAYGHSCNETRSFNTNNSFIYATPVEAASQYEFRIYNTGEGYDHTFVRNTYILQLKWNNNVAPPLVNGYTYNVEVRAMVSGVWGSFCPSTCTITIDNGMERPDALMEQATGNTSLWPNPVRDGQVTLAIDGLSTGSGADAEQQITVDVQDLFGKRVFAQEFSNSGERFTTILQLPGDIASGVYLVNITVNGESTVQRLSIVR